MSNGKIAVAMSIYKSDVIEFVKLAIDSILIQSYKNFELFIEVDGPISEPVRELLLSYSEYEHVHINFNEVNSGLACRLNQIIDKVVALGGFSYLARMDADDISDANRFRVQVDYLNEHKDISVVGSDVIEISDTGEELFYKSMAPSHEKLLCDIIKKCPFNHPSVMFNMDVFSLAGHRYKSELMNTQDYYLWVDLLSSGKKFSNINKPLLSFRVNSDFHSRRGLKKAINDVKSRLYAFKKLNVISLSNIIHIFLLFILRISPSSLKKLAYKYLR